MNHKFLQLWKKGDDEEIAKEKQSLEETKKQIEEERKIMRQEEKDKLYQEFDFLSLFAEPMEEEGWVKYLPHAAIALMFLNIIILLVKK